MSEDFKSMVSKRTEKLQDGAWVEIGFQTLKKGDRFRTFEADGKQSVDFYNGESEFVAITDAYPLENTYCVETRVQFTDIQLLDKPKI